MISYDIHCMRKQGSARWRERPRMDNIKTWTGLPVEESIRMTEDRDKWRKYVHGVADPRRLYILCWSELSRRKLSPTLATPTTLVLTTLVAQCELSSRKIGLLLEVVGRKIFTQSWQPCHSWSGKMAGRRRHCRQ